MLENLYRIERTYLNLIKNSLDLSMLLLKEKFIVTVAGDSFGSPNNIRFSYATSEKTILSMLDRLKALLVLIK